MNLELWVRHLKGLPTILAGDDQQIEELATTPRSEKPVHALTCYQGSKHPFALTMLTEIGAITRFAHPRPLGSWMGMDIREYSAGGTHHQDGITKHGNRYVRTAFIAANQRGDRTAISSPKLKARRAHAAPDWVAIADRCLRRLRKKGNRRLHAGTHPNKVKVACAREMVGFVWESLRKVVA